MNVGRRFRRYCKEIRFAFTVTVNVRSGLALMCATVMFHVLNALGLNTGFSSAHCYQIRLAEREMDLWLRTKSGDLFVFYEVFLDCCYSLPKQFCGGVANIVDLGAHVGLVSLFYLQYFPRAQIVCVEGNPVNRRLLRRNLLAFQDQVHIVEGAVSSTPGVVLFDSADRSWEGHMSQDARHGQPTVSYGMHEILAMCGLPTVNLLKIDIEGAESEVLSTRNEWLRSVDLIIIELHGEYSVENLKRDVEPLGFDVLGPDAERGNAMIMAVAKRSIGSS